MTETASNPTFSQENPATPSVIRAVADANGIDPLDLSQPLGDVIDTGALDTLFQTPGFN